METLKNAVFENSEMKEVFEKLKNYAAQGYLFHGSKEKIDTLEPRQAVDNHPSKIKNLNAVYAAHDLLRPIVLALLAKKDDSQSWTTSYSYNGEKIKVEAENAVFTPGYIHVLPKEKFQEVKDEKAKEVVAFEPITPVDIIRITPEILNLLPEITYDLK